MLDFIANFIGNEAGRTIVLPLTIVLFAMLSEDITTVVVGLLAADGIIPVAIALPFLYVGVMLGDVLFYSIGWLARTHPRLAHYIDHDSTAPLRSWINRRYALAIFSGHFVPGLRFTTYVASGFFRYPLRTYVPMALAGGFGLVTVLFSVAYWFGGFTSKWLGPGRWAIAALFLIALFFIGRHNLLAYRAKTDQT